MDPVTHAISGALAARATAPRRPGNGALSLTARTTAGAVAAVFPDIDGVLRPIDHLYYLEVHQGLTHSLVMVPPLALALALCLAVLCRGRYRWHAFVGVCALGLVMHIAGDLITAWGTQLFAPVSTERYALGTTFVIDPWLTLVLAVGLWASWRWRPRVAAAAALAVIVAMVGGHYSLKQAALAHAEARAATIDDTADVAALPQPFSPFHWKLVIQSDRNVREAHLDLLGLWGERPPEPDAWLGWRILKGYRPAEALLWVRYVRPASDAVGGPVREAWNHDAMAGFRRFAEFAVLHGTRRYNGHQCMWFADLRFALPGGVPPAFRYGVCGDEGTDPGTWSLHRLPYPAETPQPVRRPLGEPS